MTPFRILLLLLCSCAFVACDDDDDAISDNTQRFQVTIENLTAPATFAQSGSFSMPVGSSSAGPIFPGDTYEFTINAGPHVTPMDGGTRLSFATMFVQSNDLFIAPDPSGIELYDGSGNPIGNGSAVDVTDQLSIWDAGTEVNTVTGSDDQKPQQPPMGEDIGTDENGVVTKITNNSDGVNVIPDVGEVIRMTIENTGGSNFRVRITNASTSNTIATPAQGGGTRAAVPMSPGVWGVHTTDNPLFTPGEAASEGLENIAEDGFIDVASSEVMSATGLVVPLSPGVWAVHDQGIMPLYNVGSADFAEGLEAIAEDGIPTEAGATLEAKSGVETSGIINTPVGASSPAPIGPGASYQFSFDAEPGDRLSIATMYVQSNDWFYGFESDGIALFNGDDAISGDVTSMLELYDAGTEGDEYPGAGLNQVIRQSAPNTGPDDPNDTVRAVSGAPDIVANTASVIRVTVTAQ